MSDWVLGHTNEAPAIEAHRYSELAVSPKLDKARIDGIPVYLIRLSYTHGYGAVPGLVHVEFATVETGWRVEGEARIVPWD
jgi:hypothetical protein